MDEYVKRTDAEEVIDEALKRVFVTRIGADIMRKVPTADVYPIVRCRDCYYRTPDGDGVPVCTGAMAYSYTTDDWFCAGGIRK